MDLNNNRTFKKRKRPFMEHHTGKLGAEQVLFHFGESILHRSGCLHKRSSDLASREKEKGK